MDANQAKSMLQAGQSALFVEGDNLKYISGNFIADVKGVARMFSSRNWSESDIEAQRFYEASQASGVSVDEIQKTLETTEIFAYTPTSRDSRESK